MVITLLENIPNLGQIRLKIGSKLAKNGPFFSQFLAAAFLARNVSQNNFSFSREMREMCMSSNNCCRIWKSLFSSLIKNQFRNGTISSIYNTVNKCEYNLITKYNKCIWIPLDIDGNCFIIISYAFSVFLPTSWGHVLLDSWSLQNVLRYFI